MEAKIINSTMTQGQWVAIDIEDCPVIGNSEYIIVSASTWCPSEEDAPNANAICTAVNNTYGQNIDPCKVPELVSMLEECEEVLRINDYPAFADNIKRLLQTANLDNG